MCVCVCVHLTGVGYPTVYAYIMAASTMHRLLKMQSYDPTMDDEHVRAVNELRKKHKTVHVSILDVYQDLPYIRKAIFTDDSLSDAEKMMWWALVLLSLEHGCRVSETSVWGPTLAQVSCDVCCGRGVRLLFKAGSSMVACLQFKSA